jgi:hypothetical protein
MCRTSPTLFPGAAGEGLTLDLDALWAEIDRLPDGGELSG